MDVLEHGRAWAFGVLPTHRAFRPAGVDLRPTSLTPDVFCDAAAA